MQRRLTYIGIARYFCCCVSYYCTSYLTSLGSCLKCLKNLYKISDQMYMLTALSYVEKAHTLTLQDTFTVVFLCLLFAYANADTMQSCRNFDHYFI